jgi:hypothetical protein
VTGRSELKVNAAAVGTLEILARVLAQRSDAVGTDASRAARRLVPENVIAAKLGAVLAHEHGLLDIGAVGGASLFAAQVGHLLHIVALEAFALDGNVR